MQNTWIVIWSICFFSWKGVSFPIHTSTINTGVRVQNLNSLNRRFLGLGTDGDGINRAHFPLLILYSKENGSEEKDGSIDVPNVEPMIAEDIIEFLENGDAKDELNGIVADDIVEEEYEEEIKNLEAEIESLEAEIEDGDYLQETLEQNGSNSEESKLDLNEPYSDFNSYTESLSETETETETESESEKNDLDYDDEVPDVFVQPERNTNADAKQIRSPVATLVLNSGPSEEEMQELLNKQREELEYQYYIEINRTKLMLATTREELNEVLAQTSSFQKTSNDLESQLSYEIDTKEKELAKLQKDWETKYSKMLVKLSTEYKEQNEQMDQDRKNMASEIESLQNELEEARSQASRVEKTKRVMQEEFAKEIELKKLELKTLEEELTDKYVKEVEKLTAWGQENERELKRYTKEMTEKLEQTIAANEVLVAGLRKEISDLTDDLYRAEVKVKQKRRYGGILRREMNKLKQRTSFQLRKQRIDYEEQISDLEKQRDAMIQERDEVYVQLEEEKTWSTEMQQNLSNKIKEITATLEETKQKAENDLKNMQSLWESRLNKEKMKAEAEKKEIISERNNAVRIRDTQIKDLEQELASYQKLTQEYEEELSSIKSMSRRTYNLLRSRFQKRWDRLEDKYSRVKRYRKKLQSFSKRLPFMKSSKMLELSDTDDSVFE